MLKYKKETKGILITSTPIYTEEQKIGKKAIREEAVTKLTVQIESGKSFDANKEARINIISAILSSEFLDVTETPWKLSNNTIATVTLDELKEANALALAKFGNTIGI